MGKKNKKWAELAEKVGLDDGANINAIIKRHGVSRVGLRELVGEYLRIQRFRVAAELRIQKLGEQGKAVPIWTLAAHRQYAQLEGAFEEAIRAYAVYFPSISWAAENIKGMGVVSAAGIVGFIGDQEGLMVHPGKVWAYFGLAPGRTGGNRQAKSRAYLAAKGVIMAGDDYYKPLYLRRKAYEWQKNLQGANALAAKEALKAGRTAGQVWLEGRVNRFRVLEHLQSGKPFPAELPKAWLLDEPGVPMLPPGWIDGRATRWLAKLLISHLWEVEAWYLSGHRQWPYAIVHLGHPQAAYIPPKNAPWGEEKEVARLEGPKNYAEIRI